MGLADNGTEDKTDLSKWLTKENFDPYDAQKIKEQGVMLCVKIF